VPGITRSFDESGEVQAIIASAFRLAFQWAGQRWTHSIEVGGSRVASAIEGGEHDDPARVVSPAYQQLQFQEGDAGNPAQALLVGQSGKHHFSAVFTVREAENGQVELEVDVADRCRAAVEALACTYRVDLPSGDLLAADPDRAEWAVGGGKLAFEAVAPGRIGLAEAGRTATHVQAEARIDASAMTQRCVFLWRWTPAGD